MNHRTAKLLRKAAATMKVPLRRLKRHWLAQPRNKRSALRKELEAQL